MMNESTQHPAVEANIKSMQYAMTKNKQAWLDLFADNAVVKDPVGKSPLDPEGQGHQGKQSIECFWDQVIANGNVQLTAIKRYISGDKHCAVAIEGKNDMGFMETLIDMLVVYEVNEAGKIVSLSAHWDFNDMMRQIEQGKAK